MPRSRFVLPFLLVGSAPLAATAHAQAQPDFPGSILITSCVSNLTDVSRIVPGRPPATPAWNTSFNGTNRARPEPKAQPALSGRSAQPVHRE